ncbi:MAG: PepSY-like domain-containing protein [Mediterranea sp.]|jgi:hypothetical protein|nr:PepSY-like domain-containing protein [Mediterranea sp.]
MKSKIHLLLAAALVTFGLQSCDGDDFANVSPEMRSTFSTMYPDVRYVEWDIEGGYYVAEFLDGGHEKSAWFTRDGQWYMTETELFGRELPDPVKRAITNSEYANLHIDDADYVETADGSVYYRIEMEKYASRDTILKIRPDGTILGPS